jgi:hypothetical protein
MSSSQPVIYQLKLVLQEGRLVPMIWRRLLVCSDSTIADLHHIVKLTMRWAYEISPLRG